VNWFQRLFSNTVIDTRPCIAAQVIIDALDNDPDTWSESIGSLRYPPLSVKLDNATDYKSLGLEIIRGGVKLDLGLDKGAIRSAINRWVKRRQERSENQMLQDEHTLRVQRIAQYRAQLARDEQAEIQHRLLRPSA